MLQHKCNEHGKETYQHKITKHMNVRHPILKDNVLKKNIVMRFCKIKDQMAGIFTKTLVKENIFKNILYLGMQKSQDFITSFHEISLSTMLGRVCIYTSCIS